MTIRTAPTWPPASPATSPAAPAWPPASPATSPAVPTRLPTDPTTSPAAPTWPPASPATSHAAPTWPPASPATSPAVPTRLPTAPTTSPAAPTSVDPFAHGYRRGEKVAPFLVPQGQGASARPFHPRAPSIRGLGRVSRGKAIPESPILPRTGSGLAGYGSVATDAHRRGSGLKNEGNTASRRSRKFAGSAGSVKDLVASMWPRSDDRGNYAITGASPAGHTMLQCGLDPKTEEIRRKGKPMIVDSKASMWPRSEDRGNLRRKVPLRMWCSASMWPRSEDRGNSGWITHWTRMSACFNVASIRRPRKFNEQR